VLSFRLDSHCTQSPIQYDPEINQLIKIKLPPEDRRMRLDRVLFFGSKDKLSLKLHPKQIKMFATQEIPAAACSRHGIFPSDHFGLAANFGLQKNKD
jgi:hypothetical protein